MPLYDLKVDPVTSDLVVEGGDGVVITGPEEVKQAVRGALLTWAGEWDLDPSKGWMNTKGMPFGKTKSLPAVQAEVDGVIRGVEGVALVPPPIVDVKRLGGRELLIEYKAWTDTGVPIQDSVPVAV